MLGTRDPSETAGPNSGATSRDRRSRRTAFAKAAALAVAGLTALAGCTSSGGPGSTPGAAVDTTSPAASVPAAAIGAHVSPTTLGQVTSQIDTLYQQHPDLVSFTTQNVRYTAATRDKVLSVCAKGGQAADAQTLESNKVFACGPLIFFFYTYGTQKSVPAAVTVANQLYSYVATNIQGPFDAAATLGSLLRGWGLPITPKADGQATAPAETPENSLLSTAKAAILAQHGVHIDIVEAKTNPKSSAHIVADVGTTTGTQTLTSGKASAQLRLTPTYAYLAGNAAGLASFYDLSPKNISAVGGKWIAIKKGTTEYANFQSENSISALPASTLPSTETTAVATNTINGQLVYVLTWTTTADGSTTSVKVTLDLAATGNPLPISETSSGGGTTETTSFSKWGQQVTARVPTATVPFSSLAG